MTLNQKKLLGFTISWALYGALVWWLARHVEASKAAAILAVLGSATYFILLTVLFFGGRRVP